MKIQWKTVGVLLLVLGGIAALAGWGDRIEAPPDAITWARAILAMIGAAVLAAMPKILEDKNGDGVPDVLEQTTVVQQTTVKKTDGSVALGLALCIAGVGALVLASMIALSGCAQSTPVAQQATAVEVAADFTEALAHAVAAAADADARSTCPEGSDPACLDPVAARWAPVDGAIAGIRSALQAWLSADRIASAANDNPIIAAADEIEHFVRAYDDARDAFAAAHIALPLLPSAVCSVAGVPLETCAPTSGGVS